MTTFFVAHAVWESKLKSGCGQERMNGESEEMRSTFMAEAAKGLARAI